MTQHKSLIHVLEDVVLALEAEGESNQDIHSLVEMILRGFLVNGQLVPEYIELANRALEERRVMQRTVDAPPKIIVAKS